MGEGVLMMGEQEGSCRQHQVGECRVERKCHGVLAAFPADYSEGRASPGGHLCPYKGARGPRELLSQESPLRIELEAGCPWHDLCLAPLATASCLVSLCQGNVFRFKLNCPLDCLSDYKRTDVFFPSTLAYLKYQLSLGSLSVRTASVHLKDLFVWFKQICFFLLISWWVGRLLSRWPVEICIHLQLVHILPNPFQVAEVRFFF